MNIPIPNHTQVAVFVLETLAPYSHRLKDEQLLQILRNAQHLSNSLALESAKEPTELKEMHDQSYSTIVTAAILAVAQGFRNFTAQL